MPEAPIREAPIRERMKINKADAACISSCGQKDMPDITAKCRAYPLEKEKVRRNKRSY